MPYYTLIAALPHLPVHFDAERSPITLPRLEQRLTLLHEKDAHMLGQLWDFLAWDRQPRKRTDEEVVREYDRLHRTISNPVILTLVDHRLNLRTIVSALRRRRRGQSPPIGVGPLVEPIRVNWQHPQFNLQRRFPWIEEFAERMEQGEAVAAERVLYEATWQTWCRLASEFTFSVEAIFLYLARWSIIDRWMTRSAELGQKRFSKLLEETLGDHASLSG